MCIRDRQWHNRTFELGNVNESNLLKGGLADNIKTSEFSKSQLKKGIKIEREHTTNAKIAQEIAEDHLMENPKYYDALEKMEAELNEFEQGMNPYDTMNIGTNRSIQPGDTFKCLRTIIWTNGRWCDELAEDEQRFLREKIYKDSICTITPYSGKFRGPNNMGIETDRGTKSAINETALKKFFKRL
jgi:hypothetical protein